MRPFLKFEIPDDMDVVIDSFANVYGYRETIGEEQNPETKEAFMLRNIEIFIKATVKSMKISDAVSAARENEASKLDIEVIGSIS